jgi:hypothetical protein
VGRARADPDTGADLYDSEEHPFTLDNRRLYCLQEAALQVWPESCVAEVVEFQSVPRNRLRELRKFRTIDLGRSIMVGSVSDGIAFVRWSWREHQAAKASQTDSPIRSSVLELLSSLVQDDHERSEISKKISWVLRHGARDMDVEIDDRGWIRVEELLKLNYLGQIGADKFSQIVTESNKQKQRYELKVGQDGEYIRASGKKASTGATGGRERRPVERHYNAGIDKGQAPTREQARSKFSKRGAEREPPAAATRVESDSTGRGGSRGVASSIGGKPVGGGGKADQTLPTTAGAGSRSQGAKDRARDLQAAGTTAACFAKVQPSSPSFSSPVLASAAFNSQALQIRAGIQMLHEMQAMQQMQMMQQAVYAQYQLKVLQEAQEMQAAFQLQAAMSQMESMHWAPPESAICGAWSTAGEWCEGAADLQAQSVWYGGTGEDEFQQNFVHHEDIENTSVQNNPSGLRRCLEAYYT